LESIEQGFETLAILFSPVGKKSVFAESQFPPKPDRPESPGTVEPV
jgi:hypothetical protein